MSISAHPGLQALSSAVQPRALWIAAHHAELKGKLPGNWGNMLDGIDQLLVNSINDDSFAKVLVAVCKASCAATSPGVCSTCRMGGCHRLLCTCS